MKTNRRNFLKKSGVLLGIGLSLPILPSLLTSCDKNEGTLEPAITEFEVKLSDYSALSIDGGFVKIKMKGINGDFPVIVIRQSADTYIAFTSKCTHLGNEVSTPLDGKIECFHHGSIYSAVDGSVLTKPDDNTDIPPLPKFKTTLDIAAGILKISLK